MMRYTNTLSAYNVSRTTIYAFLLCVFSSVVLVLFRANEISGMSSGFASSISRGDWYFMSHHLLYQPFIRIFSVVFGVIGCDIICAGQVHSIAWSLAAVVSMFVIVQRLTGSIATGLITAVFFLGTNGFLIYATQLEPYAPLLGANAIIATILLTRIDRPLELREITLIIVLYILSLFFHQANIFYLVPITVILKLKYGREGLWIAFWIALISGIVTASTNALVFWNLHPQESFGDFYRWLMYYSVISNDSHGSWQQVWNLDFGRLAGAMRQTVIVFFEAPDSGLQKPLRLLFFSGLATAMIWNLVHVRWKSPHSHERIFFLTWTIVFGLFGYWWLPSVYKFYLFLVMPLTALSSLMVYDIFQLMQASDIARRLFLGLLAVVILGTVGMNVSGSAWSLATGRSPIYSLSERLSEAAPSSCSLYSVRSMAGLIGYYHKRRIRPFNLMFQKYQYQSAKPDVAKALRVSIDLESENCAVIPLYWLSQEYFYSRPRTSRIVDNGDNSGLESPPWVDFLEWILNSRKELDSDGISYNPFSVFLYENEAYVRIDRQQRSLASSPEELIRAINEAAESYPLGGYAGEEFRQAGSFRQRAFGYF